MIELKPNTENHFICPECNSANPIINDIIVQSIHVIANCTCRYCDLTFYQTFPVGHSVNGMHSIHETNGQLYKHNGSWLGLALDKAVKNVRKDSVGIRKIIYEKREQVVILNALDYLYGHVLLKLYNAQYHLDHHQDLGLIVIIPKSFEWLIPAGCAEAWLIDLNLKDFAFGYEAIGRFVSEQFQRFDKIYLSKAYSHPDFTKIDITRFAGIQPFDVSNFTHQKPTITFVLREDRWWMTSRIDYWTYRVCRKLNIMSWGSRMLSIRQNKKVRKAIKRLGKQLPDASFFIVGLGKTGSFDKYAIDLRRRKITPDNEKEWCRAYAASHVVVGVHGSNMLLPTAFAAGCVEIFPGDRYGNILQDISVRYNDRRQLFLYRFAGHYESPKSVAEKVAAIVNDFDEFDKSMCQNIYPSKSLDLAG